MYNSTLSLTLALDGVGGQRHTPAALPPGKTQHPLYEAGWAPGPVWTGAENLAPNGTRPPERPARSVVAISNELSRNQTVTKSNMTATGLFSVNS